MRISPNEYRSSNMPCDAPASGTVRRRCGPSRPTVDTQEKLIRLVVFARLIEKAEFGDRLHLQPSPARQTPTAKAAHLITEQFDRAFVEAIVVRLQNSALVAVDQLDEALLLNGRPDHRVQIGGRTFQLKLPLHKDPPAPWECHYF